jgi:ribokinase
MMKGEVISVGSINLDIQVRMDQWPQAGETAIGRDFLMAGGGKAANVAFLARKLQVGARLIARVGSDRLVDWALQSLRESGVDLGHTLPAAGPTGWAMIAVRGDGEKTIIMAANANDAWTRENDHQGVWTAVRQAPPGSILVVDLEIPSRIVEEALQAAREQGMPVILDPSPADRFRSEWASSIDYLTPNSAEAEKLTGLKIKTVDQAYAAGERLLAQGIGTVLLKMGNEGCAVVNPGMAGAGTDLEGGNGGYHRCRRCLCRRPDRCPP